MPYVTPAGGSRAPAPKPGPQLGRISKLAWRQPIGGVRATAPTAGTR
jgi:hypothetical protein